MKFRVMAVLVFLSGTTLQATTWPVGPGHPFTAPSQVSNLVGDGDTVLIDAGTYSGDVAFWKADNLVLAGNGGMAMLDAGGKSAGQKAIWVIQGDNTTVEWIGFLNCTVPDKNGAGIRQEGSDLTVRHCLFDHNEDGILAGDNGNSTILIEYCEFGFNGYGDGYSHNLYINHVGKLVFRYNYSHDASIGHLVKSRAHENHILYNRLDSSPGAKPSYEIDLPNGGPAYIIGNEILQPADGDNSGVISYGLEGLTNPGAHELHAINNTMINRKSVGRFFNLNASTALFHARNNLLCGGGSFMSNAVQIADTLANLFFADPDLAGFEDWPTMDLHLTGNSPAIDQGVDPGSVNGLPLWPGYEYLHPADRTIRPVHGPPDVGAFEGPMASGTGQSQPAAGDFRFWRSGHILMHSDLLSGDAVTVSTVDGKSWSRYPEDAEMILPDGPVLVTVWREGARPWTVLLL